MADDWRLTYEGYDPEREGLREALCTLGNGYFATRGCASESIADDVHYPGTYVAGVYNRLASTIQGREVFNEDLVNLPNWLPLDFRLEDGGWFSPDSVHLIDYWQTLDLQEGILIRELRFDDGDGRITRVRSQRLVSMASPHLAGQKIEIEAENWTGKIEVSSTLDGQVKNTGVARYRGLSNQHLQPVDEEFPGEAIQLLKVRTCQSGIGIAVGAVTSFQIDGEALRVDRKNEKRSGFTQQVVQFELCQGQRLVVEKICSIYTTHDRAISKYSEAVMDELRQTPSFEELYTAHKLRWLQLWERFGLEFGWSPPEGVERTAVILRLHIFHLLQTVSPHTRFADAGVPARGLHGEAYRGHVFWDELFALPVFNLRMPELSRNLLMYRYRRLPAARRAAQDAGFAGAMFPWQSGSDGKEQTQTWHLNPRSGEWAPDRSHLQRHVGLAIAFNVWDYYQVTQDLEFLSNFGAELFLEIASFWASMATYDKQQDRYDIRNVMGPDEYHDGYPGREEEGLSNNTYTNVMVSWLLWKALKLLESLPRRREQALCVQLGLAKQDLDRWRRISTKLKLIIHQDGIPSQFEGYEELEEFDWDKYRDQYGNIRRLDRILDAEGTTPNRFKVSKQADVLMLFYLLPFSELQQVFDRLGYHFNSDIMDRTISYYLQRTSDGSTLSQVVHAHLVAQRNPENSWNLFVEALRSDIDDVQGGTTQEGIHLGAMAGIVDLMQRMFVGMEARVDGLYLNPVLPAPLTCLQLTVYFRGHSLDLDIQREKVTVSVDLSNLSPFRIVVQGKKDLLSPGDCRSYEIK